MNDMNKSLAQAKANKAAQNQNTQMNEINRKLGILIEMVEKIVDDKLQELVQELKDKKKASKKTTSKKGE